jgi:hypothetical protein
MLVVIGNDGFGYPAGGGDLPDRLVVDLGADGQAKVLSWPDGGIPEEVSQAPSPRGHMPLADWLVPVHYARRDVRFPQAHTVRPAVKPSLDGALDQIGAAPSEAGATEDPLAANDGVFVGRDDLFYESSSARARSLSRTARSSLIVVSLIQSAYFLYELRASNGSAHGSVHCYVTPQP